MCKPPVSTREFPSSPWTDGASDIMNRLLVIIALILAMLVTPSLADVANMTFTEKTFNVASGGSTPYFYGIAKNSTGVLFFMPGKGEQRATLDWLNRIPLNTSVRMEYDNYVISGGYNITNTSNWVAL